MSKRLLILGRLPMSLLRQTLGGILHIFYPATCGLCGQLLAQHESHFCSNCHYRLTNDEAAACPRCAATVGPFANVADGCSSCRKKHLKFDAAFRLGNYDGLLRDVILRMKYRAGEELAEALAQLWAEELAPRVSGLGADAVVPVPLHWRRRFARGYNQSEILGQALARQLHLPCQLRWLRRIRHTPQQTQQTHASRWENMRGAFGAQPAAALRGATCLLVDDVLTTGSTCSDAARALRKAGANRVEVAIVARSQL